MASVAIRFKAVDLLLFVASDVCGRFLFGACFVMVNFMSFLVLQPLCRDRERVLVALLNCVPTVVWLLVFCFSSSRCCGLV